MTNLFSPFDKLTRKWSKSLLLLLSFVLVSGCEQSPLSSVKAEPQLTIYSGITMVKPLMILTKEFEKQHNISIEIKQGASGYLYNTLKVERLGDIYFPGSDSYRIKNKAEGLLTDYVLVGYNRLSFEVLKGNPKNLTDDLNQLTNPQLSVVLSSPESGSVGKNAKMLLDSVGITDAVYQNVTYFTTDSHRIYTAIKNGDADIALNWYATTQWPDHKPYVDAILLPETLAKPKRLELNLLSFSKHPDLAKAFMAFASSEHGLQVFADYGFFTPSELQAQLSKLRETQSKQSKL
ncbi:substrate-binding domain-containing protein [Thiosulfativibrio zosterae]|uniref:ABC transporter substrate-binding protein n=1 Tax=Thiosulfativibrio zosterae TaxID=2675053 RepID=A0A6F8PJS0_9GAMM|nr:substrate-binding domain-containing protein [Thiosulfativibrio zosterae]BBP42351.1 ABC transporter substrate-binding protein [Thiosulfativibrio zosterae]